MPDTILVPVANVLPDVASAVTAALNEADDDTFSQAFEAVRSYADWELPLEDPDCDKLMVDVVPVSKLDTELETQGSVKYQPEVDIVARIRLGPEKREANGKFTLEEIDALVLFVQQLAEFFTAGRLESLEGAAWDSEKGNKILAAYKPTHLRQHHQFTGIVRVPFRVSREFA